jgi:hypothetical protein
VISASKELEPGARAMLLLAGGLFRLDVVLSGDTLRTVVRNLSTGELEMQRRPGNDAGASIAYGDAAAYEPGRASVEFALGSGADRVTAEVLIGTLRFADRGTIQVTAQAIVRQSMQARA